VNRLMLFVAALVLFGGVEPARSQVPDAVLKSKELADARSCMKNLLENGKKANLEADGKLSETFVLNPTREPLVPIAAELAKCMSSAFPKSDIRKQRATNLPHRVWWVNIEGIYIYCATPEGPNTKDGVSPLGGNGPKRAWMGIYARCQLGKEIAI
jgi:hypothetical protein